MSKRILIPLDGSKFAERALEVGIDFAQQRRLEIDLLQVVSEEWELEYAEKYLQEKVSTVSKHQVACHHRAALGQAPEVIAEASQSADLLVMASHGRSGFDRFALGSVTEKVLRRADCPVFIVRDRVIRLREIRRVLLPLDGFELSLKALPEATKICLATGASLVLTRINEAAGFELGLLSREDEAMELDRYLKEVAATIDPSITVETIHGFGSASRTLLKQIEERDIDLVVMSSHGRSGFNLWVCGSVAENVVRGSVAPVLLVRQTEE